jgi:hypothetical protein
MNNGTDCKQIGYISGLTADQCKNPFPKQPSVPDVSSSGYFDGEKRCWVAVQNGGWQNLPCSPGTLPQQYIKVPLMYPDVKPTDVGIEAGAPEESVFYEKAIETQHPPGTPSR